MVIIPSPSLVRDRWPQVRHCSAMAANDLPALVMANEMEPLSTALTPFIPHLLSLFVDMLKDTEDDVRNNSIYWLGELVLWARASTSCPPTTSRS